MRGQAEARSPGQCLVEKAGNDRIVDLAGAVVQSGSKRIENDHVRDAASIILLAKFLLVSGKVAIEVHYTNCTRLLYFSYRLRLRRACRFEL